MSVEPVSPYRSGAVMFRPTSETTRPSPSNQEEVNLKVLDQTEKSTNLLRRNYLKEVT
ncbi:MAG: hypothetical protein JW938_03560 [Candidatus Omnitrophica bacterium]|nr:hypothetical protein [Candidatus Omnitrophota bacterium]